MTGKSPIILWFRRDLRLTDHSALAAAALSGQPIVPVLLLDEAVAGYGAAARWRFGRAAEALAGGLNDIGSRLILRRGKAADALAALAHETGANAVYWTRLYDPDARRLGGEVKRALTGKGIEARSFPGHVLFEPQDVETGQGGPYRVYTPFWRAVKDRPVLAPSAPPRKLAAPETWPSGESLADWALGAGLKRGEAVLARYAAAGEGPARERLEAFADVSIALYEARRNDLGVWGTSRLSENLAWGEISVAACWHAGQRAAAAGKAGAESFLRELVWRDFAYHLAFHSPEITSLSWREEWRDFPWSEDETRPEVIAWKRGRTGIELVDAAMREMYATGRMHNRARMVAASYLTKHLLADWRIGQRWFADCLTDWDAASNAMGWQWVAGSGPDAAPYFRVFNPEAQAAKFDPSRLYRRAWIAEGQARPGESALAYFEAAPKSWGLSPGDPYPEPVVTAEAGRARALAAYETWRGRGTSVLRRAAGSA
jgi:deoxyribodipyrimidine photo-lyase